MSETAVAALQKDVENGRRAKSWLKRVLVLPCDSCTLPLLEGRMLVGWTLKLSFSLSLLSSPSHSLVTEE